MGTEITDTEAVTAPLKRITLGPMKFRVPASPTLDYMFWMREFVQKFNAQELVDDDIVDCYDRTVDFLEQFNPKVDQARLKRVATLADLVSFYSRCYGADSELEDDDAGPPRVRAPRGTSGAKRTAKQSAS